MRKTTPLLTGALAATTVSVSLFMPAGGSHEFSLPDFGYMAAIWTLSVVGVLISIMGYRPPFSLRRTVETVRLGIAYMASLGFVFLTHIDYGLGLERDVDVTFSALAILAALAAPNLGYAYSLVAFTAGLLITEIVNFLALGGGLHVPYGVFITEYFVAVGCGLIACFFHRLFTTPGLHSRPATAIDECTLFVNYLPFIEDEDRLVLAVNPHGEVFYMNRCSRLRLDYNEPSPDRGAIIEPLDAENGSDLEPILAQLSGGESWSGEVLIRAADGGEIIESVVMKAVFDLHNRFTGAIVRGDRRDADNVEAQNIRNAFFDNLTQLPNREFTLDRLRDEIDIAARQDWLVAVMAIGIDGFKDINEAYGRDVGDQTLVNLGERLRGNCRPIDTVARLGGDEFAAVLPAMSSRDDIHDAVQRMLKLFADPIRVNERQIIAVPSVGVSVFSAEADDAQKKIDDPETMLREADTAMREAKVSLQRSRFVFFSPELNEKSSQRIDIVHRARLAFEREQFSIAYQPIVDLNNPHAIGLEALLRWRDEENGKMIPPDLFVPILEKANMIQPIGKWVLEKACRQAARWHRDHLPVSFISVNVSSFQFDDDDFADDVRKICEDSQLAFKKLHLEVTESVILNQSRKSRQALDHLRGLGILVCMDDFGKGYSSLEYLKRFPFDILKIDRVFASGVPDDEPNVVVVKWAVKMAEVFDMKVVAEGIEHRKELEFLKSIHCDMIQGYLFGRPAGPEEAGTLLEDLKSLENADADAVLDFLTERSQTIEEKKTIEEKNKKAAPRIA